MFEVLEQGQECTMNFYKLPHGGYWSVKRNNGHEIFYPSEKDAQHAFDHIEVALAARNKGGDIDEQDDAVGE